VAILLSGRVSAITSHLLLVDKCDKAQDQCSQTFSNTVTAYGTTDHGLVEDRVEEFLTMVGGDALLAQPGVVGISNIEVKQDKTNRAIDGNNALQSDGNVAAKTIGSIAAALAFILLLILLIRRNRDDDQVSHVKLEEGDETFVREFETDASSPEYKDRNAHVVGEADSIFSGWTGYTKDGADQNDQGIPGRLGHQHGDVHVCSSATCEVCEQKRREGVQFIPTGTPPRLDGLPSGAAREYVSEDTVEL